MHVLGTPPAFILSQDQTLMLKSCSCSPRLFWPLPALLFLGRLLLSMFEKFSLRIFQGCFTVQLSRLCRCRISNFYKISHLHCCVNNFFHLLFAFCDFSWRSCEKYNSKKHYQCQQLFTKNLTKILPEIFVGVKHKNTGQNPLCPDGFCPAYTSIILYRKISTIAMTALC